MGYAIIGGIKYKPWQARTNGSIGSAVIYPQKSMFISVPPLSKHLVEVGNEVSRGDAIAVDNGFYYYSPFNGFVDEIPDDGIYITTSDKPALIDEYTRLPEYKGDITSEFSSQLIDYMCLAGIQAANDIKTGKVNIPAGKKILINALGGIAPGEEEAFIGGAKLFLMAIGIRSCAVAISESDIDTLDGILDQSYDQKMFTLLKLPNIYPLSHNRILARTLFNADFEKRYVITAAELIAVYNAFVNKKPCFEHTVMIHHGDNTVKAVLPNCISAGDLRGIINDFFSSDHTAVLKGNEKKGFPMNDGDIIGITVSSVALIKREDKQAPNACIYCGKCADICPMKLNPSLLITHKNKRSYGIDKCIKCGACEDICPESIDFTGLIYEEV